MFTKILPAQYYHLDCIEYRQHNIFEKKAYYILRLLTHYYFFPFFAIAFFPPTHFPFLFFLLLLFLVFIALFFLF